MPPHIPRPRPRPIPGHRPHGFYPRQPIVYDLPTQSFVVDSSGPELPWRVTHYNSWGRSVVYRSADKAAAAKFFLSLNNAQLGFNVTVELQHWDGAGWQTVAQRNSQGNTVQGSLRGLNDNAAVKEGITMGTAILAGLAILGAYLIL